MNKVQNQYNYHYLFEIKKKLTTVYQEKSLDALALLSKPN